MRRYVLSVGGHSRARNVLRVDIFDLKSFQTFREYQRAIIAGRQPTSLADRHECTRHWLVVQSRSA